MFLEITAPTRPSLYNEEPLHLDNGRWWIFRLEITTYQSHVYLKGKAWKKGKPEPGSWLLEASDHSSERYQSGQTGVWTINAGSSYGGQNLIISSC